MSRFARRPSRAQSRRLASSLSLFFVACLALLLVCPLAVKADEDAKAKYGPVIGIGASSPISSSARSLLTASRRSGNNVSGCIATRAHAGADSPLATPAWVSSAAGG